MEVLFWSTAAPNCGNASICRQKTIHFATDGIELDEFPPTFGISMKQQFSITSLIQCCLNGAVNQSLGNTANRRLPHKLLIRFQRCVRKVPGEGTLTFDTLNLAMKFRDQRKHAYWKLLFPFGNDNAHCLALIRGIAGHFGEVVMDRNEFQIAWPAPSNVSPDFTGCFAVM